MVINERPTMFSKIMLFGTLVIGIVPILMTLKFRRQLARKNDHPQPSIIQYAPKVGVILPCKGIDQNFQENIMGWLHQDIENCELIFVTEDNTDPAYDYIKKLLLETRDRVPQKNCNVITSVVHSGRAQKITNQLAAIDHMSKEVAVYVFVDSDLMPHRSMLRELVAPLQDSKVGATTGGRWYFSPKGNPGSVVRSLWTAAALPIAADPNSSFTFGGAMAVPKNIFEKANIRSRLDRAVSDSFAVTNGVRSLKLEIEFVPSCVCISHEFSTLSETIEFTNRQSIISRVSYPKLWRLAAFAHSSNVICTLYGIFHLGLAVLNGFQLDLYAVSCISIIFFQMLNGMVFVSTLANMFPEVSKSLLKLKWTYIWLAPVTVLVSFLNTINSLRTNRIKWRGITYELKSESETIRI